MERRSNDFLFARDAPETDDLLTGDPGKLHPCAKDLQKATRDEIIRLLGSGLDTAQVAERTGVSRKRVGQIRRYAGGEIALAAGRRIDGTPVPVEGRPAAREREAEQGGRKAGQSGQEAEQNARETEQNARHQCVTVHIPAARRPDEGAGESPAAPEEGGNGDGLPPFRDWVDERRGALWRAIELRMRAGIVIPPACVKEYNRLTVLLEESDKD